MVAAILYLSNTLAAEAAGSQEYQVLGQVVRIKDRIVWCNVLVFLEGTAG